MNIRCIIFLTILIYSIFHPFLIYSQNIALEKKYTLSEKPNYPLSALSSDNNSLTDGKFSNIDHRAFWTKKTTVGWQGIPRVIIQVDLNIISNIDKISFNTARNISSGVKYPQHVLVFISQDDLKYKYVGDIVNDTSNTIGSLQVRKFTLDNINDIGRYVKIIAITDGKYLFCDEIEIYKSNKIVGNQNNHVLIPYNEVLEYTNSIINKIKNANNLNSEIQSLRINDDRKVSEFLNKEDVNQLAAERLSEKFKTSYIVEKTNPWMNYSSLYFPSHNLSELSYWFNLKMKGFNYGAFQITNTSKKNINIVMNETANESVKLDLYTAPFISSSLSKPIVDPLLPYPRLSKISISPGRTEVIFFKVKATKIGLSNSSIVLSDGNKVVHLSIQTRNFKDESNYSLNANNWAYFDYPLISNKIPTAIEDLNAHGINTFPVQRKYLKIGNYDFKNFEKYISTIGINDRILLFMNFAQPDAKFIYPNREISFMSKDWKEEFIQWYASLLKFITIKGFKKENIYFYPYDEVKGKDINDYILFAEWANKHVADMKLFATVSNDEALKVGHYVDIIQIYRPLFKKERSKISNLPSQIWIYDVINYARESEPYERYRLLSWEAYLYDLKGVGFWNYAQVYKSKLTNEISEDYIYGNSDYSVIYTAKEKNLIITSRRWEAFSLGLEDYKILKNYEKVLGQNVIKEMAKKVIENSTNTYMADSVISEIYKSSSDLK